MKTSGFRCETKFRLLVFLGHPSIHAYYTELSLQNCNNAQKRRICRENSKYAPDENFCGHFCPHRKAATLCWGAHYGGDIDDDDIDVVRGEVF